MGFDIRTAVMSGLYGVHAMAESKRKNMEVQREQDKERWARRMHEQQMGQQQVQAMNSYMFDQDRLELERKKLTVEQAKLAVDRARDEEIARQREENWKSLDLDRKERAKDRDAALAERGREADNRNKIDQQKANSLDLIRKHTTEGTHRASVASILKEYTNVVRERLTEKQRANAQMFRDQPEGMIEEAKKEAMEAIGPLINAYNAEREAESVLWTSSGQQGPKPDPQISIEDLLATEQAPDVKSMHSGMNIATPETLERYKELNEDPGFIDRWKKGTLADEELSILKLHSKQGYEVYILNKAAKSPENPENTEQESDEEKPPPNAMETAIEKSKKAAADKKKFGKTPGYKSPEQIEADEKKMAEINKKYGWGSMIGYKDLNVIPLVPKR